MPREPLAIPLREARAPLVLALDTSTSGLRVLLFDMRGRLRAGMERQRVLEGALAPLMS